MNAASDSDVLEAVAYAKDEHLPLYVLGAGSNVLVKSGQIKGLVLRVRTSAISCTAHHDDVYVTADAGVAWEDFVDYCVSRGWYGVENLAGIPGTVGGATVQNIGAYGVELSRLFMSCECVDLSTGTRVNVNKEESRFGYRHSIFKERPELIIERVQFRLYKNGTFITDYPDIKAAVQDHGLPTTPVTMAHCVRMIRERKFPPSNSAGTAGSLFKNPILSEEECKRLSAHYPELPRFSVATNQVKISLAWILDRVLHLKGMRKDLVGLYEKQPLVLVAFKGATADAVEEFANAIAQKVFDATGICIEREVENFSPKYFF